MATLSNEQFIEKLGALVAKSDRMILVVSEVVEVRSRFFNYEDIQKLTYLLQRTSCEWWIKPFDSGMLTLRIRLFYLPL